MDPKIENTSEEELKPNFKQKYMEEEPEQLSPLTLRPLPKLSRPIDEDYEPEDSELGVDEGDQKFLTSPLKRSAEDEAAYRPLKRQKGLLNGEYLNLLNEDIEDASQGVCLDALDDDVPPSQFGLTFWSSVEKNVFFESLGRLGPHDLAGIASRIRTKSVIEVKSYIELLKEGNAQRALQQNIRRQAVAFPEFPAAVELSQQCCHALDEAADIISLRQEHREKQREEQKWGELWDLTPSVANRLHKGQESLDEVGSLPSLKLFHLTSWLSLSQEFFMNSSIPANNWNHVDNVPPSIWATAFEDFRSLTISITRRLVQSALYAASTRIKTTRELRPTRKNVVRREDVEVALSSLSMEPNSRDFWRKCARRNRLEVIDDELDPENTTVPMTYGDVESALLEADEMVSETKLKSSLSRQDKENESDLEDDTTSFELPASDDEERAVEDEMNEVFGHSLADFPETFRMKQALRNRIETEHRQEHFAEDCDQYASYNEEIEMWDLLQRAPPMDIPKVPDPGPPLQSNLDVESLYPLGRDWRRNTRFYSHWETMGGSRE